MRDGLGRALKIYGIATVATELGFPFVSVYYVQFVKFTLKRRSGVALKLLSGVFVVDSLSPGNTTRSSYLLRLIYRGSNSAFDVILNHFMGIHILKLSRNHFSDFNLKTYSAFLLLNFS